VKAFFADLCCLSCLLFTNLPPGGSPARTLYLLPAPSSRRIAPNAGGCAGESSGVGRSVNKVAGAATFTSQPHPCVQRTGRRLAECHVVPCSRPYASG
jgi:hypothetical protein